MPRPSARPLRRSMARLSGALSYDLLYFFDLESPEGVPEQALDEIAAASAAGYRCALLWPGGPSRDGDRDPLPPQLTSLLGRGALALADPRANALETGLLLIHRPQDLLSAVADWQVKAELSLLVLDRSPLTREGALALDLDRLGSAVLGRGGVKPHWAGALPQVQKRLSAKAGALNLLEGGWPSTLDPRRWRRRPKAGNGMRPQAGRSSLPQKPGAWPGDPRVFLSRYPVSRHLSLYLQGVPEAIFATLERPPANWQIFPPEAPSLERFLGKLDFYIHYPDPEVPDLLEHALLAAMQRGALAVLPTRLAADFGDAALVPEDGRAAIELMTELHRDPESYRRQQARADALIAERHAPERLKARLSRLVGKPGAAAVPYRSATALPAARESKRLLFVTSNGVGMGHLTRLLAIAKRLPSDWQPVFATMSQAIAVLRGAGYHAEHLPFHAYAECDSVTWNRWLEVELSLLIERLDPRAAVYDGGSPHRGIVRALTRRDGLPAIWCRRGMWQDPMWDDALAQSKFFDLVIEPGELAGERDIGASVRQRDRVELVEPILLLDEGELLSRREAAAALGLDPKRPALLLQLGAGNQVTLMPALAEIRRALAAADGWQVVLAEWLMAERSLAVGPEIRHLRAYPQSRYLKAFDAAVSAAGYNAFHELLHYGMPTLFMPVERPELDDQCGRARWARDKRLALMATHGNLRDLRPQLARLLDPAERAALAAACRLARRPNGASEAARLVIERALQPV